MSWSSTHVLFWIIGPTSVAGGGGGGVNRAAVLANGNWYYASALESMRAKLCFYYNFCSCFGPKMSFSNMASVTNFQSWSAMRGGEFHGNPCCSGILSSLGLYGVCGSRNSRRFGRRVTDLKIGNAGPI